MLTFINGFKLLKTWCWRRLNTDPQIFLKERTKLKFLCVRLITLLSVIILVAACGDGGGGSSGSSGLSVSSATVNLATPTGTPCGTVDNSLSQPIASNSDVFGNLSFWVSSVIGSKPWSCLIVNKSNDQPVFDGNQSVRFEVRSGDCTAPNYTSISDCVNDRSRSEINTADQNSGVHPASTQGQIITYQYRIYIPTQPLIRPATAKGAPNNVLTVLTQLRNTHTSDALAYLVIDAAGALYLQTHKDFSWVPNQIVAIDLKPQDKWITLKYVVKSTSAADGFVWIYVNDELVFNETRATLPDAAQTQMLKIGIYNSFLSAAAQPWQTQVVYFDSISTKIENF